GAAAAAPGAAANERARSLRARPIRAPEGAGGAPGGEGTAVTRGHLAVHIQANLEDELVQEALKSGVDLREYSKQVELELQEVERASIRDCILQGGPGGERGHLDKLKIKVSSSWPPGDEDRDTGRAEAPCALPRLSPRSGSSSCRRSTPSASP
uniref:Uncharacterized protein n=1 Tax=Nothoprocta perdicaria TaxID=30464 RepID=A0A8C6YZU4_NOTPE